LTNQKLIPEVAAFRESIENNSDTKKSLENAFNSIP
jgi:hypothetical protein